MGCQERQCPWDRVQASLGFPGERSAILHNRHCMFTWICPKCGGAVDVAEEKCPRCSGAAEADSTDETTADLPPPTRERSAPAVAERSRAPSPADESEQVAGNGLQLGPKHYLIFAAALAAAILGAVWLSGGFSGLRFEDPDEMSESPVETFAIGVRDDIEVAAVRPYYDEAYQAHVRAFVANHSKQERAVALRVFLRVKEASPTGFPIATFDVITQTPLAPNEGREFDVPLLAMGTLQSFPRWDEMRVDLETIPAQGN